jgi:hypothetical protein
VKHQAVLDRFDQRDARISSAARLLPDDAGARFRPDHVAHRHDLCELFERHGFTVSGADPTGAGATGSGASATLSCS